MNNPYRRTIDGRSPAARNLRLRGAALDMDGNVTGGKDSLSGSQVNVPARNRDAFKIAPIMGDGMAFFNGNKSQPQMRPMTGPYSPQGQQQTLDRVRGVVADARTAPTPTGARITTATDGVNTIRRVAGKYGSGTASTGPLATSTVAKEKTPFMPAPASEGSGVTGIVDGYRKSLTEKPLQPEGQRMDFRKLAKF